MPPRPAPTIDEMLVCFDECYNALSQSYWEASTIEGKDQIIGCLEFVSDLIDILLIRDLTSRTEQYEEAAPAIAQGKKKLDELKAEIDRLVHRVATVTRVIGAIERALKIWRFLPG